MPCDCDDTQPHVINLSKPMDSIRVKRVEWRRALVLLGWALQALLPAHLASAAEALVAGPDGSPLAISVKKL